MALLCRPSLVEQWMNVARPTLRGSEGLDFVRHESTNKNRKYIIQTQVNKNFIILLQKKSIIQEKTNKKQTKKLIEVCIDRPMNNTYKLN